MSGLHAGATVTELVPGNPADLDRLVACCRTVANGLGGAAARVRAIDAVHPTIYVAMPWLEELSKLLG